MRSGRVYVPPNRLFVVRNVGRAVKFGLVMLICLHAVIVKASLRSGEMINVGADLASGGWQARVVAAPPSSMIRFQPGLYRAEAGGCNISLPADVHMVADAPGTVVIDCQGTGHRHFVVAAGARAVLDGLTLANGTSGADAGCVLVAAGGTITIRNSIMTNCIADNNGGALYLAEGGTCTILKSVLENCVASGSGGGIYMLSSSLRLSQSSIHRCAAGSCTSSCNGGALFTHGSDVWMSGGSLFDNSAGDQGGAMFADNSWVSIKGADMTACRARIGGGVSVLSANTTVQLTDVVVQHCAASLHAGGVYVRYGCLNVTRNVTFLKNSAGKDGGGIRLFSAGKLVLGNDVVFDGNEAYQDGGGIALHVAAELEGMLTVKTIGKVTFQNNYAGLDGGAIRVFGSGNLSFGTGVVFKENVAGDDGGALAFQTSSSIINGKITVTTTGKVVLENNRARDKGGGMYIADNIMTNNNERSITVELFDGVEIRACSGVEGGAVWMQRGRVVMTRPRIQECHADALGGALYCTEECEVVSTGGSFGDNTAGKSGGMAYISDSSHLILTSGVEIFGGHAERGAGVYVDMRSVLDLTDSVILHENSASVHGGGLYIRLSSIVTMTSGVVLDANVAVSLHGGAMYVRSDSVVTMTDGVIIRNNHATCGGAVYADASAMLKLARNVSCIHNSAEDDSGCVHLTGGSHLVASDNVTFADNSAGDDAGALSAQDSASLLRFERGVLFSGNIARNKGGAMHLDGPVLFEIKDGVEFVQNFARISGGALSMARTHISREGGVYFISHTIFLDNVCSGLGGAIHHSSDSSTLIIGGNVRIQGNLAQIAGGGIFSAGTTILMLSGVTFESNGAGFLVFGHVSEGGGLHLVGATASIDACTFAHNFAVNGGGIFLLDSKVNITGGVMAYRNVAAAEGGFLCVRDGSDVHLGPGTNISLNVAGSGGGVTLDTASMSALDGHVTISNNQAVGVGGGVHLIQGGKVHLIGVQISGNFAGVDDTSTRSSGVGLSSGAGLYSHDSFVSMTECRFENNVAANGGGAVHFVESGSGDVSPGRFRAKDCIFQSNAGEFGGAIVLQSQGIASFESCNFVKNVAQSQRQCSADSRTRIHDMPFCGCGGGIAVLGIAVVHLERSRFEANYAQAEYALVDDSFTTVLEQESSRLAERSGSGGALFLQSSASATIKDVVFLFNRAASDGGAIAIVQDSRMLLQGLVALISNSAAHLGGAMYLGPVVSTVEVLVTCDNLDMQNNKAELSGGAIFSSRSLQFNANGRSTLHGNKAGGTGGAIALLENVMILKQGHSMQVAHNEAGAHGGGFALLSGAWISISEDEACSADCSGASRGNGVCDPQCLNRACNWDDGDCNVRFENAGHDAQESCNRHVNTCSFVGQASTTCTGACFLASCDYSKQGCASEKEHLKTCPVLDAKVYSSLNNVAPSLKFLKGGTSQGYGTCSQNLCHMPLPAPNVLEIKGPGRIGGSALLLDGGSWLNLAGLDDALSAACSSHFTVEAWTKMPCLVQSTQESQPGNSAQLAFLLAGENLAIALLTDRATPCFAWPLVFAGAAPSGACSAQNTVLTASTGRIGDGPGMLSRSQQPWSQQPCSWTIAPPNAASVTLIFTEFFLVQAIGQSFIDTLSICICANVECLVPNSCSHLSGSDVPAPFTSTTGIMRVILETSTSKTFPSVPGFTAAYAAAYDSARIDAQLWHHLAFTIEPALTNSSDAALMDSSLLNVYVDGMVSFVDVLSWDPAHAAPFAGEFGVAIGLGAPHWQPSEQDYLRESLGYPKGTPRSSVSGTERNRGQFNGSIDEVRVWQIRRSSLEINASKELTCSDLKHDLVACYSFDDDDGDTHFKDESARGLVTAQSAPGLSPHLPWCINRQDEGQVQVTALNATARIPVSWGFCSNTPRLPGAGYVYDAKQMHDLAQGLASASQALLEEYPGCGHVALNVSRNSASRNGGAFYVDTCERQGRCFLRGLEPDSGSRAAMLHYNVALQGGGGAVFVGCSTLGSTCLKTFNQENNLGVLPHLPKFSVKHNRGGYGDDFASDPTYLQIVGVGHEFTVVPGQQRLELSVLAMDSSLNRCTYLEDDVQVLVCKKDGACSMKSAVSAINFYNSVPESGVFSILQDFECPVVDETAFSSSPFLYSTIQVSMVRYDNIEKQHILVRCGWCRKGESRKIVDGGKTWTCAKCEANQYTMDPNNMAHGCKDCPAQASCDDGSLNPLVGELNTHWKPDTANGVFTLQGCPAGYSLEKGLCIVCKPRTYCQGADSAALACPSGTHSAPAATSAANCIEVEMVVSTVKMPLSLVRFNEVRGLFKQAIAAAASTNASNVIIVSVRQIAGRRFGWFREDSSRGEEENASNSASRRNGQDEIYGTDSLAQSLIAIEIAAANLAEARTMIEKMDASSIHRNFQAKGLPDAEFYSKPQLSSEMGDSTRALRPEYIAFIVVGFVVLCFGGVLSLCWWTSRTVQLDDTELALLKMVSIVRGKLGMTRKDGFFLSNETPTLWERCYGTFKRSAIIVEKRNMEELARIRMVQDFEISYVDALVIFLSELACNAESHTAVSDTLSLSIDQQDCETPLVQEKRQRNRRFDALRTFLLCTCESLLSSEFVHHLDEINVTTEELEAHGININVLNGKAARGQKEHTVGYPERNKSETAAAEDRILHTTLGAIEMSNRQTSTLGPQKISSKMVLQRNIAGRQSGLEDDDFRFRFLQEKILKLQVWRMENMSLFLELSGIAQEKMDVYASICQYKFEVMKRTPHGLALTAFRSRNYPRSVIRQDDATVRAVRVDEENRQECAAFLKYQSLTTKDPLAPRRANELNEDVFVTQLVARAQLVNLEFQVTIKQILRSHEVARTETSRAGKGFSRFLCNFFNGIRGPVELYSAPCKSRERIRDKLLEYVPLNCPYTPLSRDSGWPLTGNILDPVRCSVVVENASQILQILSWLEDTDCGVTVCKVKNRYSEYAEVLDGYRDMVVTVLFTDSSNGLSIIGEIQLHLQEFWGLKKQMHKLYKIKRAETPDAV